MNNFLGYKFRALKGTMTPAEYVYFEKVFMEMRQEFRVFMRSPDGMNWMQAITADEKIEITANTGATIPLSAEIGGTVTGIVTAEATGRALETEVQESHSVNVAATAGIDNYREMQSVIALDEDVAIAFMKYTGQNWKAFVVATEDFTPAVASVMIYETEAIAITGAGSLNAHISPLTALNTQGRGILETKWNSSVCLRLAYHTAVSRTASNIHLVSAISMYRHIKLDDLIGKKLSELDEVKLKEMHYVQIT